MQADRVSGGDVLVRIEVPSKVSLSDVQVALNGYFEEAVIFFTGCIEQRTGIAAQQAMPAIREIPDMAAVNMPTAK